MNRRELVVKMFAPYFYDKLVPTLTMGSQNHSTNENV